MIKKPKAPYQRERGLPFVARFPRKLYGFRVLNGVTTVLADTTSVVLKNFPNLMVDYVTPGFAQRRDSGELVMNPMRSVHTQYTGSDGGFKVRSSSTANFESWEESSNVGPVYFGPPVPHSRSETSLANLRNYVATKTRAAVRPTDFQGLVALAEGRKTIAQLADPLSSLKSLLQYVTQLRQAKKNLAITVVDGSTRLINGRRFRVMFKKHKGPGHIVRPPKSSIVVPAGAAISGSVLAHNLGLRPLLMDIDSIMKQIPNAHKTERQTYRESGVTEEKYVETRTYTSGAYVFTAEVVTSIKTTVRGVAVAADNFNVSQDFGVSLYDIPEAFWELLPYSFLLDYFANIGDYLSALRACATQNIVGACLTTVIDTTVTRTWKTTSCSNWIIERALKGGDLLVTREKSRETGLGVPTLAYVPRAAALTPSHVQNMLSLVVQQLTGFATQSRRTPFR